MSNKMLILGLMTAFLLNGTPNTAQSQDPATRPSSQTSISDLLKPKQLTQTDYDLKQAKRGLEKIRAESGLKTDITTANFIDYFQNSDWAASISELEKITGQGNLDSNSINPQIFYVLVGGSKDYGIFTNNPNDYSPGKFMVIKENDSYSAQVAGKTRFIFPSEEESRKALSDIVKNDIALRYSEPGYTKNEIVFIKGSDGSITPTVSVVGFTQLDSSGKFNGKGITNYKLDRRESKNLTVYNLLTPNQDGIKIVSTVGELVIPSSSSLVLTDYERFYILNENKTAITICFGGKKTTSKAVKGIYGDDPHIIRTGAYSVSFKNPLQRDSINIDPRTKSAYIGLPPQETHLEILYIK